MPTPLIISHNWIENVVRRREWRTSILVARDGSEQRRRLRQNPIETVSYTLTTFDEQELAAVLDPIWNSPGLSVEVPRWEDELWLIQTIPVGGTSAVPMVDATLRQFGPAYNEGRAILFREEQSGQVWWEVVTVEDVTAGLLTLAAPGATVEWAPGTRLVPMIVGRLSSPVSRSEFGGVLGQSKIDVELDEDFAGVTDGGEAEAMVAALVRIY
jgi:hypothetical protein